MGDKIAKYLERMEKSNTQLLKLADLIQRAKDDEEDDNSIDEDNIFEQIKNGGAN